MKLSRKSIQSQPPWQHASMEEYAAFVHTYAHTPDSQYGMLHNYQLFVKQYPDLLDWFQVPLTERIGRLYGQTTLQSSFPLSYRARPYLMFLAVRGYVRFDWDWLLAINRLWIDPLLAWAKLDLGVSKLVNVATRLGYTRSQGDIHLDLSWSIKRLFVQTPIQSVDEGTDDHLAELSQAIQTFDKRVDVTPFFGSAAKYQRIAEDRRQSLYRLHIVLYHHGQVATYPSIRKRRDSPPALKPEMEGVITRYRAGRRQMNHPGTVAPINTTLHKLVAWLAEEHPEVETWAEVTRY